MSSSESQATAQTKAPEPEPTFKELTPDIKAGIDLAIEQGGVSAVLKHIADGSNGVAMTELKAGNRKGVLLQMKIGQVTTRAANAILKSETRAEKGQDDEEEADGGEGGEGGEGSATTV